MMKYQIKLWMATAAILASGVLTAVLADEDPPKTEVLNGLGWQKNSCLSRKLYMDPVKLHVDMNVDVTQNILGSLTIDTQVRVIECCSSCGEEHAWCNFEADHEGC
ncbi:MAG: hypothetical protein R6V75_02500 [Bacteroidales bacterium]